MSGKPYLHMQAAAERVRLVASQLTEQLLEFNERNPDPDAESVAGSLDYVTEDYLTQLCVLTLAEAHIVVPDEHKGSDEGGSTFRLRNQVKSREMGSEGRTLETETT
jgi:hypothetical protein